MFGTGFFIISIIVLVIYISVIIYALLNMYRKVPSNRALIVTGIRGKRVVAGGGTIVFPLVEQASELSLEAKLIEIKTQEILTQDKVPISIQAVATVKIGNLPEDILKASETLLGKTEQQIEKIIKEILEGHIIDVVAKTSLQKLLHDREALVAEVNKSAILDIEKLGLAMENFTIKDVIDTKGFIEKLSSNISLKLNNVYLDINYQKINLEAYFILGYNDIPLAIQNLFYNSNDQVQDFLIKLYR
jgi:flotillin